MSKHFVWIWLLVGTPVAVAQDSVASGQPPAPTDTGQPPLFSSPIASSPEPAELDLSGDDYSTFPSDPSISDFERELKHLREEREAVANLRQDTENAKESLESMELGAAVYHRKMLRDLLDYLARGGIHGPPGRKPIVSSSVKSTERMPSLPSTPQPADLMALGKAHFRNKDFDQALVVFRKIAEVQPEQQTVQDHLFLQYMIATCLRKQEKFDEALDAYSEVAASQDDEILAGYAKWQLELIRWRQRLERRTGELNQTTTQLKQLIEEMELSLPAPSPPAERKRSGEEQ